VGNITRILENIQQGYINKNELVYLLSLEEEAEKKILFSKAEDVCNTIYGKKVYIRGIIELSNYCKKNCNYCGIRRDNSAQIRYRIEPDEALHLAVDAYKAGYRTVVIQSGEDRCSAEKLTKLIAAIKKKVDIVITLSVGEYPESVYQQWKHAGADRYLLRIETTDPELFSSLHPDDDLTSRTQCLFALKRLGYEVGTGIMIGLPGQTLNSIAADIIFFRELDADMIGVGPFIPHEDTPLALCTSQEFDLTLKVVAITRLLNPDANIPETSAMVTLDPEGREKALQVGANVIMPNFTPQDYRSYYKLYNNKICINEGSNKCRHCVDSIAHKAGKQIIIDKGFRKKQNIHT
jgi:biotin synthase